MKKSCYSFYTQNSLKLIDDFHCICIKCADIMLDLCYRFPFSSPIWRVLGGFLIKGVGSDNICLINPL